MHKRRRALLITALSLVTGTALAQSLGSGAGMDDLYPGKGTGIVPSNSVLLIDTGSAMLIDTGSKVLIQ